VAISQDDASRISRIDPFASSGAKNSIVSAMPSVDPANDRIYVIDGGAGKLAAINFNGGNLSLAWSVDQTTLCFTTLIGPSNARVLIGTNIPVKTFQGLKNYTQEQVVWRSADTGTELARSDYFDKMVTGILVTPGFGGLMYYLAQDGTIQVWNALQGQSIITFLSEANSVAWSPGDCFIATGVA
jgi:WD40 repeat protein